MRTLVCLILLTSNLCFANYVYGVDYSISNAPINYNVDKVINYDLNNPKSDDTKSITKNKDCTCGTNCQCIPGSCPGNCPDYSNKAFNNQTSATVPQVIPQTLQTIVSYRQPTGHTHTCLHCGEVWDHQKNSGHNCQNCGSAQYVQDRVPKLVPIKTKTYIQTTPQAITSQSTQLSAPYYTINNFPSGCVSGSCGIQSSGCINGSCGLPTYSYRR